MRFSELPPETRRAIVDHCARELNFVRYGTRTPYYLWADSNKREVTTVLESADRFVQRKTGKVGTSPADL